MAKTNTPTNTNVNTNNNVNTNINHVNVIIPESNAKKETKPNWYKKTIIGGIITLALSISGYYIKQQIDLKNSVNPTTIQSKVPPVVETTKTNP